MGFDSMPGWAIGAGALLKAPEVANDYMGLFKNVQAMRDEANASDALQKIQQFKTPEEAYTYKPDGYLSPASRQTLEKLRADKLDNLMRVGAAAPLAQVRDLQMDPRFQDQASVQEINQNPTQAVFGQNPPRLGGFVPGETKGDLTAAPGVNPYVAQGLQSYQQEMQDKLARFKAASGDKWAGAGLNKDQSIAFKDVAQGTEMYNKNDLLTEAHSAEGQLNATVRDYPLERNVNSWDGLVNKLRGIPGLDPKLIDSTLKDVASRNQAPVGAPLTQFTRNGPNSTTGAVNVDMFGEPVASTRVTSTNNPSDRELGLIPDKSGKTTGPQWATVSYPGPDGNTVEQQIDMSDRLNAELVSQTVDKARRGVKGYHVTVPTTSSRGETTYKSYGTKPAAVKGSAFADLVKGGGAPAPQAADPLGLRR